MSYALIVRFGDTYFIINISKNTIVLYVRAIVIIVLKHGVEIRS